MRKTGEILYDRIKFSVIICLVYLLGKDVPVPLVGTGLPPKQNDILSFLSGALAIHQSFQKTGQGLFPGGRVSRVCFSDRNFRAPDGDSSCPHAHRAANAYTSGSSFQSSQSGSGRNTDPTL